jgi:glycosyltransferase involved in cell wall biosynthesis
MRIVYVLTSLGVGGAERQALAIADRMARRGHSVAILALRPVVVEEWPTGLRVVHLDIRKSPRSVIAGLMRAHRFLREFRPHLLHSHSFHANIFARLLKLLFPSIKVVSTVHNVYEGGGQRMLAYRLTDSLACRTIVVSQAAADRFLLLKAIRPDKCRVVPNGIDLAEFTPSEDRRNGMRVELAAGSSFVWLAAGRMVPAKDLPNLLRAFTLVREAFPDAQLWIAGAVPGAEMKKVRRADGIGWSLVGLSSSSRGFHEGVRRFGLRRDMPALFDAADAFVLSSAWEGLPLAVGEAMATPVSSCPSQTPAPSPQPCST